MELISQLSAEHRALAEQADALLDIVRANVPDPASVAAMRWRLAQALVDHCAREEREVYARLFASGDRAATRLAWEQRELHGALAEEVRRYVAAWPIDRIGREWQAFGRATALLVAALYRRIAAEEALVYPAAIRIAARRAAPVPDAASTAAAPSRRSATG